MREPFNCLYKYLEKEAIKVNKEEFIFQIQSHPDYPSILAIADALTFFNIKNGVVRVDVPEIELLPEYFIAVLAGENDKPARDNQLYFVEQKGASYFCTKEKKTNEITKVKLESRWNGIVLLLEKEETAPVIDTKKSNLSWVFPFFGILFFLATLFVVKESFIANLFFILPVLGVLFSISALKDLFGTKSELLNKFCNISSATSCTTVVNSDKWKIFKFLNFSDLSIIFFTVQFIGLFMLMLSGDSASFFSVQKILLLLSLPVILLSLYYQKFVEKKWCPLCLVIIGITIVELIYLALFETNYFTITNKSLFVLCLVSSIVALIWFTLKKLLMKQKELKEFQLTANRFMRNYDLFKNSLLAKRKIDLPYSPIILGNKESKIEITVITNPFCGHCENVHKNLEEILELNHDNLKIKVIISTNIDVLEEEKKHFFRSLMCIYLEKGEVLFLEALNFWFKTKNLNNWVKRYELPFDSAKMDFIYQQNNPWFSNNDFKFTPVIFINGYEYPKGYSSENLEFFVKELVEDDFFELV